jgi:peptidoglycan/xylan/chitin deacetylase (PgdA/CDA1 family)
MERHSPSSAVIAILLYHRIGAAGRDPLGLNTTPTSLERHVRAATACFQFLTLTDVVGRMRTDATRPALAITFDDGYSGVYESAQPILERYEIPFCVFVPTGFIGNRREFWWDELESLLAPDHSLPSHFRTEVNGLPIVWNEKERWSFRDRRLEPRNRLYYRLAQALLRVDELERQRVLSELREWADWDPAPRRDRIPLSADELRALASSDLVEIGAHTVSHPMLSAVDDGTQAREIAKSKSDLETLLGKTIHSFAYPFGGRRDYTAASVNHVKNTGFVRACANIQGPVTGASEVFELPRFIVHDWSPATFMRAVTKVTGGRRRARLAR